MKQQTLNLLEENKHNPTYCSACSHEAKRHTPIGCDQVTAATRRYAFKNVV